MRITADASHSDCIKTKDFGRYRVLLDGYVVMNCIAASEEGGYIIPHSGPPKFGRVKIIDRKAEMIAEQRKQGR